MLETTGVAPASVGETLPSGYVQYGDDGFSREDTPTSNSRRGGGHSKGLARVRFHEALTALSRV